MAKMLYAMKYIYKFSFLINLTDVGVIAVRVYLKTWILTFIAATAHSIICSFFINELHYRSNEAQNKAAKSKFKRHLWYLAEKKLDHFASKPSNVVAFFSPPRLP